MNTDFSEPLYPCFIRVHPWPHKMPALLFWIFALVMLGFGAAVVLNRNPIASALSLVMCFMGLSALFMSLDAFFIGIIQVLVYAGAVMVLFLFIIMLLDLRVETRRKTNVVAVVGVRPWLWLSLSRSTLSSGS